MSEAERNNLQDKEAEAKLEDEARWAQWKAFANLFLCSQKKGEEHMIMMMSKVIRIKEDAEEEMQFYIIPSFQIGPTDSGDEIRGIQIMALNSKGLRLNINASVNERTSIEDSEQSMKYDITGYHARIFDEFVARDPSEIADIVSYLGKRIEQDNIDTFNEESTAIIFPTQRIDFQEGETSVDDDKAYLPALKQAVIARGIIKQTHSN